MVLGLSSFGSAATHAADAPSPADARILKALQSPTRLDVKLVGLQDLAEYLSDYHSIDIRLDTDAFDKAGIKHKPLVFTIQLEDVPLRRALHATLGQNNLSFMVQDGQLLVTTPKAAEAWQRRDSAKAK